MNTYFTEYENLEVITLIHQRYSYTFITTE